MESLFSPLRWIFWKWLQKMIPRVELTPSQNYINSPEDLLSPLNWLSPLNLPCRKHTTPVEVELHPGIPQGELFSSFFSFDWKRIWFRRRILQLELPSFLKLCQRMILLGCMVPDKASQLANDMKESYAIKKGYQKWRTTYTLHLLHVTVQLYCVFP